uniref:Uncharacterized protein n=1 Tax=Amphimedon queenslandica TaxID=400682 RepID=A0A1X7T4E1_AMPQE
MEKEEIVESESTTESTETNEPPKKKEETVESLAKSETNEPPRKRRRLSLSSNKKNKGRFGAPVDEEQVVEASRESFQKIRSIETSGLFVILISGWRIEIGKFLMMLSHKIYYTVKI